MLLVWPVALTTSFAKTTVSKVLEERATAAAHNDAIVAAPPAGTTCGLQFTNRLHADSLLDSLRRSPFERCYPDGYSPRRLRQARAATPTWTRIYPGL